jgi:hypothetical protein
VDCLPGLVCTSASGNGLCVLPPFIPGTECAVAGSHCGDPGDPTCCGVCKGSSCVDLTDAPCSRLTGAQCQAQTDCCIDLRCVFDAGVGSCQPTCGTERAPCDPSRGNADCCLDYGFTCVGWGVDGGAPFACNDMAIVLPDSGCVAACMDGGPPQCQLGAPCNPNYTAGGLDPCYPAGLVCNEFSGTCGTPPFGAYCAEGGAPCRDSPDRDLFGQYLRNANVALECVQPTGFDAPICTQLCQSTRDCADPYGTCCVDCVPSSCGHYPSTCIDPYGVCNAEGTADGRCEPLPPFGNFCVQANINGGGPGSACDDLANRENPAFCDFADLCQFGVCVPTCNTSGDPMCPSILQSCMPNPNSTYGRCITLCSLWESGGCPTVNGGVPQVCAPALDANDLSEDSVGLCVAQQANPSPIGAACIPHHGANSLVSSPSPCVAGTMCLNDVASNDWTCRQLCELAGGGAPPCPAGSTCHPIAVGPEIATTHIGVCLGSGRSDAG